MVQSQNELENHRSLHWLSTNEVQSHFVIKGAWDRLPREHLHLHAVVRLAFVHDIFFVVHEIHARAVNILPAAFMETHANPNRFLAIPGTRLSLKT